MYTQRVSAPPMQTSSNRDIESQNECCTANTICPNIIRALGLTTAVLQTWLAVRSAQEGDTKNAALSGIIAIGALGGVLLSEICYNTSVARALGACINQCEDNQH